MSHQQSTLDDGNSINLFGIEIAANNENKFAQ